MIKYKNTIIFDFDGTLVDTMHIFADVASHLISENYNINKEDARKLYFETSGYPFHKQLDIMFEGHKLNSKVAPIYEEQKLDAITDVRIEEEEYNALKILKDSDFDLIISSNNSQQNIDNFMSNYLLHDIFSLALGFKEDFGCDYALSLKEDDSVRNNSLLITLLVGGIILLILLIILAVTLKSKRK